MLVSLICKPEISELSELLELLELFFGVFFDNEPLYDISCGENFLTLGSDFDEDEDAEGREDDEDAEGREEDEDDEEDDGDDKDDNNDFDDDDFDEDNEADKDDGNDFDEDNEADKDDGNDFDDDDFDALILLEVLLVSSSSKISKIKLDDFFLLTDLDFSIFLIFVASRSTALSIKKILKGP